MTTPERTTVRAWAAHAMGVIWVCDHDEHLTYRAVLETSGPEVIARLIRAGIDTGWLHRSPELGAPYYATLELLDDHGVIVEELTIPTAQAFGWWERVVELRQVLGLSTVPTARACRSRHRRCRVTG